MQAYLREQLIEHLVELHDLANRYSEGSPAFLQHALDWLKRLEQVLTRLRHPLSGMIASQRMKLEAALEGHIESAHHSKRKAARFRAVDLLAEVDRQVRETVERIDLRFDEWRDKIAQLAALAAATNGGIDLSQPLDRARLKSIWSSFGERGEGANMYRYLSAVMPEADLLYLLEDILDNMAGHSSG